MAVWWRTCVAWRFLMFLSLGGSGLSGLVTICQFCHWTEWVRVVVLAWCWQVLRVSGAGLGLAEFTPPSVVEKRRKSYEAKGEAVTLNHKPDAFEAFKKSRKAQLGWATLLFPSFGRHVL